MEELSLYDIFSILKRRRRYILLTGGVLFAIVIFAAAHWSNYRSTATVQIEQSNVSEALAAPTGSNPEEMTEALADQRISQVEQTVTSLDSLSAIINKFNLYPDARKTTSMAALAAKMAKKIDLTFIGSTLSNPAEAQKASAEQLSAIAFTLSFDYDDPKITQQVTNELVSRFLEEDLELRRHQAEETSNFLGAQIASLETTMADQEKKIADFRAQHGDSGPAALMFNQQALESTNLELQNIETEISTNEGTEGNLRAQLATVDPYTRVIADGQVLTTPAIQLKALQSQYATLSGQYGPEHPDVVKLKHQIEALQAEQKSDKEGSSSVDTAGLQAQIEDVKTNLAAAKATGGDSNPNVIGLQRQLKKLQVRLASAGQSAEDNDTKRDADNPAYLQLVSQLHSTQEQHKSLLAQRDALLAQQEKYQHAVAENPIDEQQMESLSRDYDNEQLRYRELKEKKMAADMSEQLEAGRKGQRLIVNVPPNLPTKTHPSRLLIMAGGLVLSVIGGLGAALLVEATSQNLYGGHQLAQITGTLPLVTVPHISTAAEIAHTRRLRPLIIAGIIGSIVLAAFLFPYLIMPYDVFWSTVTQKLDFL
jgi:uncharacterized protein involved in exopolysaccharide biosynthesis